MEEEKQSAVNEPVKRKAGRPKGRSFACMPDSLPEVDKYIKNDEDEIIKSFENGIIESKELKRQQAEMAKCKYFGLLRVPLPEDFFKFSKMDQFEYVWNYFDQNYSIPDLYNVIPYKLHAYVRLRAAPENYDKSDDVLLKKAGYTEKNMLELKDKANKDRITNDPAVMVLVRKLKMQNYEIFRRKNTNIATPEDLFSFFSGIALDGLMVNRKAQDFEKVSDIKIRMDAADKLAKMLGLFSGPPNREITLTIKLPDLDDQNLIGQSTIKQINYEVVDAVYKEIFNDELDSEEEDQTEEEESYQ